LTCIHNPKTLILNRKINNMGFFNSGKHAEIVANEIKRGQAFLAENAKREGVTETPSGLQYEVLVQGDGEKPSGPRAKVLTHYHGTTIDGIVFDSYVLRNEPISFGLNQVITGWTEGYN
jgi:FKBP-type peptidyl-prolyl cis-trans isomerase